MKPHLLYHKVLIFSIFLLFSYSSLAQVTYNGNGNTGFGNPVGTSTLDITHTGTTISGTFTKGSSDLNDIIVIYISNGTSGRTSINFNDNDQSDDLRRAVTNAFGQAINFPAGFEATHAIAIKVNESALFNFPSSGDIGTGSGNNELIFIDFVGNPTSNTQVSFTFSFDWAEIGLTSADDFGFIVTYGDGSGGTNNDAMFSSDEGYGNGIPTPNPGFNGWSYTTYFDYPSGDVGGLAESAQTGDWSAASTWVNGNVPLSGDEVVINQDHTVTLNQDANVSGLTTRSNSGSNLGILFFELNQGRTLEIRDGGVLEVNGGFGPGNDSTLTFLGQGTILNTNPSSSNITLDNVIIFGGVDFGTDALIDGELIIETGGFVDTNPPTYTSNATLIYSDDGNTYGRGLEWSATSGAGYPNNVIIRDNTTLQLAANGGAGIDFICFGDLTVESGSTLTLATPDMVRPLRVIGNFLNEGTVTLSGSVGGDLELFGNFDNNGTFNSNNRALFFIGGFPQTVDSTADPLSIDFIIIDKPSNNVQLLQNLDLPNNLEMTQGNLDLNGNTLSISGDIRPNSGSGTIIGNATGSTIIFDDASSARTIEAGDFQNNEITNLTFDESAGVAINTDLKVTGTFDINAGDNSISSTSVLDIDGATLDVALGSSLTFESDGSGSAQVETISAPTSITGSGNITAERHMSSNRAFRYVSSPVGGSQTIREAWQENASTGNFDPNPGFGTHITGEQGTVGNVNPTSGLDETLSGNPSLYTFNNTQQFYEPVASTNVTLQAGIPYALFVRGDRSVDLTDNLAEGTTTLRATGALLTGTQTTGTNGLPALNATAQEFSLVGNTYQAIVDFQQLTFTGGVNPNFLYLFDPSAPNFGDFVILDKTVPAEASEMFIRPGQSFFVVNETSGVTTPEITFNEDDKATGATPTTTVFSELTLANLELYNANNQRLDMVKFRFEENASNGADNFDALKLVNQGENIGRFINNKLYEIERRTIPQDNEVIPLTISQYQGTQYELRLVTDNWDDAIDAFVLDNYLNTTTPIDVDQAYSFTVDANIPASIAEDRFSLIFNNTTLGVEDNEFGTNFSVYPNPTKDGLFSITTSGLSGEVSLEISNILGQVVQAQSLQVTGNEVNVNAQSLSSGVYLVNLTQGGKNFTSKVIIE